jgi:hypothetical protein
MKKITNNMPSVDLVEGYLTEIAKGYGVRWKSAVGDNQSNEPQGLAVSGFNTHDGVSSLIHTRTRLNKTREM